MGTLWAIWLHRNEVLFHNTAVHPDKIHDKITRFKMDQSILLDLQEQSTRIQGFFHSTESETPPGFMIANIGKSATGTPHITVLVDVSWYKKLGKGDCA